MLKVYAAAWCPHCVKTVKFLEENQIEFVYFDIEKQPEDVLKKIIEVNGGHDWVVPTLEYQGLWRKEKFFNAEGLKKDLEEMGAI